jgi:hypothetical protein
MQNSVFFPQSLLDVLFGVGKLDLDGDDLVVTEGNYRYRVTEAVRVLSEVTTGEDPYDLVGKVAGNEHLANKLGAELLGNSMLVEENAYDVVPGMLGEPTGDVDPSVEAGQREEDMLASLQNIEDV